MAGVARRNWMQREEDFISCWLIGFLAGCRCVLLEFVERVLASAVSVFLKLQS
jgi:hypothetical protein